MVIGTPNSWDPTISFSGKDPYRFCAWSPCGRFIAAQTEKIVEIRNQLTFELLAVLHPTKNTSLPTSPLAYSPDGRYLASGLSNTVVIWDIQTGGVAKEIECCWVVVSMAWSFDGRIVAAILRSKEKILCVETHEVASGARLFTEDIEPGVNYWRLWAHKGTFRLMTIPSYHENAPTFDMSISEIGATLIRIESFTVGKELWRRPLGSIIFSPSTYRVSISGAYNSQIVDIRHSGCLLEEKDNLTSPEFSPDGRFFAASNSLGTYTWKYTSGGYVQQGGSLFRRDHGISTREISLHFSPTSSSILAQRRNFLQLRRSDDPPATSQAHVKRAAISRSGAHIATAYKGERIVTIIDVPSQTPSQLIDTGMEIQGLVITGSVLVVAGEGTVKAWLLTEEGTVDGVFGDKRADHNDSIWSITTSHWVMDFTVRGQVGVVRSNDPFIYHTKTGDILDHDSKPEDEPGSWNTFLGRSDMLQHRSRSHYKAPSEDGWLVSYDTMRGAGWVKDSEGRCRFWIPVEWRDSLSSWNWYHDITTIFTSVGDQLIVIKL